MSCPPLVDQPQSPEPSRPQHSPGGRFQQARRKGHSLRGDNAIPGHLCCCSHPRHKRGCSTQVREAASNSVGSPSERQPWKCHLPLWWYQSCQSELLIRAAICPKSRSSPTGPEHRQHQWPVVRPPLGFLHGSCLAQTQARDSQRSHHLRARGQGQGREGCWGDTPFSASNKRCVEEQGSLQAAVFHEQTQRFDQNS